MALFDVTLQSNSDNYTLPQILDMIQRLVECNGHETEVFLHYGYSISWVSAIKRTIKAFESVAIHIVQQQPTISHADWIEALWKLLQTTEELTPEQKASVADLTYEQFAELTNIVIRWNPTHNEARTFDLFVTENKVIV